MTGTFTILNTVILAALLLFALDARSNDRLTFCVALHGSTPKAVDCFDKWKLAPTASSWREERRWY